MEEIERITEPPPPHPVSIGEIHLSELKSLKCNNTSSEFSSRHFFKLLLIPLGVLILLAVGVGSFILGAGK